MLNFMPQPEVTGAMAEYPYSAHLASLFKFKSRFDDEVDMTLRRGNRLLVPRACVPLGVIDKRRRVANPTAISCTLTPRNDEQLPLAHKALDLLLAGESFVFQAPTGWGKSVVGAYIAARLGQPTMIVVTKEDLKVSWYKALTEVLHIPPSQIGFVQQDRCDWQGKQFVIGMVHSLVIEDRYPQAMYDAFGFLLLDEVHLMAADTFMLACTKFPAYYRMGMSATPDRKDGKWRVIESHIGKVKVRGHMIPMKPKVLIKHTGWGIPKRKVWRNGMQEWETIPYSPGRMMPVTKAQAESNPRNYLIVEFVQAAYKAERRTLILADTKEHLERLFHLLTSAGISGDKIGYYVGGMKQAALDSAKMRPVILATFKMCSTGTDVPVWDTLVLATPKADVAQSVGRVLRENPDKKQPVILELVDKDAIFGNFHKARMKYYYSIKADIVSMQ